MRRFFVLTLVLGISPLLSGYKFIDPPRAWNLNDLPVEYWVGNSEPDDLSFDEKMLLIQTSYDKWADVPCSPLEAAPGASAGCDNCEPGEIDNDTSGFGESNMTIITFDGGGKDDLGSGPLAATVTHDNGNPLSHNGHAFFEVSAMNIIYNEDLRWGTPETVASPSCHQTFDFVGVTTHEIGHGFGLGHSCDDGEPCPDPTLRGATMYWSVTNCDDGQQTPNEDDIAGINAIYGVAVDFDLADQEGGVVVGPSPLDVSVSVPEDYLDGRFTSFEWNFGDVSDHVIQMPDAQGEVEPLSHSYTVEGQYTITLQVEGTDEDCGGAVTALQRKVGVVLACGEPAPAFSWSNEGDFVVAFENTSPLGTFGCITDFAWILDGNEDGAIRTYEPTWSFDEAGTHSVTLRASGAGGTGEVTIDVQVEGQSDAGCACSAATAQPFSLSALAVLLGLGGVGIGWRRRRS